MPRSHIPSLTSDAPLPSDLHAAVAHHRAQGIEREATERLREVVDALLNAIADLVYDGPDRPEGASVAVLRERMRSEAGAAGNDERAARFFRCVAWLLEEVELDLTPLIEDKRGTSHG